MDNFSKLAIEDCLISQMPRLFSPDAITTLDDNVITEITMETESAAWERAQNDDRLELCDSALLDMKSIESMRAPGEREVRLGGKQHLTDMLCSAPDL